jgi:hypothetical protein
MKILQSVLKFNVLYLAHTLISFRLVVGILMLPWQSAKVYGIEPASVNQCSLIAK